MYTITLQSIGACERLLYGGGESDSLLGQLDVLRFPLHFGRSGAFVRLYVCATASLCDCVIGRAICLVIPLGYTGTMASTPVCHLVNELT